MQAVVAAVLEGIQAVPLVVALVVAETVATVRQDQMPRLTRAAAVAVLDDLLTTARII
jgi:hypothetical protein